MLCNTSDTCFPSPKACERGRTETMAIFALHYFIPSFGRPTALTKIRPSAEVKTIDAMQNMPQLL